MNGIIQKKKRKTQPKKTYFNAKQNFLDFMNAYVECNCGCYVKKSNLTSHLQTQKHQKLMLLQNQKPVG